MQDREEIALRVKETIAEQLGLELESVKENDVLERDLGADSIDVLELVMNFEDVFEIEINDEDVKKLISVQNVIDFITEKKGA